VIVSLDRMASTHVVQRLTEVQRDAIARLLSNVTRHDGGQPLSDHLRMDLDDTASDTYLGVLWCVDACDDAYGEESGVEASGVELAGYAQLQHGNAVWSLEVVVDPGHRGDIAGLRELVAAASAAIARRGGGAANWWVLPAGLGDADVDAAVVGTGFALGRELHQMRRPLPIEETTDVAVRPFVVGRDEDAWLHVNNRAFATHPEQGGWTPAMLAQREHEPWFDPAGFLLHERDGRLAAFCWTKVHADTAPPMGEIYAIAVDPDFPGLGLGSKLTTAGLIHLASRGLHVGMLYVDGGNTNAVTLYERLGFTIDHTDRAYLADIDADTQADIDVDTQADTTADTQADTTADTTADTQEAPR
jgi:mycothiol synthase